MFKQFNIQSDSGSTSASKSKVSDLLSDKAVSLVPLFDHCEASKNATIGVYCPSAIVMQCDTKYDTPTIHLSLDYSDVCALFKEENVKALMSIDVGSAGVNFPFSTLSSGDDSRIVLKVKCSRVIYSATDISIGSVCPVVIVPNAYKPFGGAQTPGISLRIATFIPKNK